ncbi:hypothetical protein BGZ60DRAFT_560923 [Tricladium varicosporioides]|nr:hypothetical protein BGZ60DRAFT_560923 [Hymenoscyphus varicosporioides]
MDKVRQSINDVERKLTKIMKITEKGMEKVTVTDMIKLGQKGNSINSTIIKGKKAYEGVEPTEQEARELLTQFTRIVEMEEKQMAFTVQNKPFFEKMHVAGMVKKNLQKSEESSEAMSFMIVNKSPTCLKVEAEALDKRARKGFADTVRAFEGATGGEDQVGDKDDDSE